MGGYAVGDQTVLVVDFGAQYAQLIARRVREARVYSEIVPATIPAEEIRRRRPIGIVLSGGPKSVHVEGAPLLDPEIYHCGVPILGICYGAQLLAAQLGGEVARTGRGEYGRTELLATSAGRLSDGAAGAAHGVDEPLRRHRDACPTASRSRPAPPTAPSPPWRTAGGASTGCSSTRRSPTPRAASACSSASSSTCAGPARTGPPPRSSRRRPRRSASRSGTGRALCGLSGGVDSAVAAALVHRAIGTRLTCVFVDTGLMRAGEAAQVEDTFHRHQGMELIHVRAADRFLERLAGVVDPEEKRKAVGELFIRVFEEARGGIADAGFLVQGTLYPDVIESGTATAAKIKSHHNVGGLPDDLDFELVEPLRSLFKDEVRRLGTELGLPEEIVWRQPFPGPGLSVRIIGEVTAERVALLQQADVIVRDEIRAAGLERQIWQAFAVLADIRSVGVMGDERTYGHPIIIRAVESDDAMTADWARLPHDLLERMASRIIGEVRGINRVVYDITSKPPATIEWE